MKKSESNKFQLVTIQVVSSNSDINCNKLIQKIDQQLYKKYKLSEEEIAFVEGMIKPMGD
jgi:translation elongation factor EF-1beta